MNHVQPPTQLRGVIKGILLYLKDYPDAKDTSDGVRRWWLGKTSENFTFQEIVQALDWMTSAGWLTERETTSDLKIYGLNRTQSENIEDMLRSLDNQN